MAQPGDRQHFQRGKRYREKLHPSPYMSNSGERRSLSRGRDNNSYPDATNAGPDGFSARGPQRGSGRFKNRYRGGAGGNRSMEDQSQTSVLCRYWLSGGTCWKYPNCRFRHDLRRVLRLNGAHQRGIYSLYSQSMEPSEEEQQSLKVSPGTSIVALYTASQDKTVKKWYLFPSKKDEVLPDDPPKLKLQPAQTYHVGAPCLSITVGHGCLVCGLNTGDIKLFEGSSTMPMTLKGHGAEVHCVRFIDTVLVSGDWSGKLLFWKANPDQKTLEPSLAINIESPITCLAEVGFTDPHTGSIVRRLWVGCTGKIVIVDLNSLAISKSITLPGQEDIASPVVMALLPVEAHVLCCVLGGGVKVHSAETGEELQLSTQLPQRPFCSMTGAYTGDSPVLLCGTTQGSVAVLDLPQMSLRHEFRPHERDIRAMLNIGGTPSYFVTAAMDGESHNSSCLTPSLKDRSAFFIGASRHHHHHHKDVTIPRPYSFHLDD